MSFRGWVVVAVVVVVGGAAADPLGWARPLAAQWSEAPGPRRVRRRRAPGRRGGWTRSPASVASRRRMSAARPRRGPRRAPSPRASRVLGVRGGGRARGQAGGRRGAAWRGARLARWVRPGPQREPRRPAGGRRTERREEWGRTAWTGPSDPSTPVKYPSAAA